MRFTDRFSRTRGLFPGLYDNAPWFNYEELGVKVSQSAFDPVAKAALLRAVEHELTLVDRFFHVSIAHVLPFMNE